MRKALILASVFMILAGIYPVMAQEQEPESNLTPRQILLLQVPESHVLRLTIADQSKNPPEVRGYVLWSVLQRDSAPGGPFELIRFILENRIESYLVIGSKLKEVLWKGYEEEDYLLAGTFKNNVLEITFLATGKELTVEETKAVSANMMAWVKTILQRLNILDDADLAQHIRSQKFGSAKKATSL